MALYELKNEQISITVDSHGAELKSLKKLADDQEYMWCGDAKFWGRTSPVLFPFVGGLKNKEYRFEGKTYSMTQHGFARDMDFELETQTESELWFTLESTEETLARYPFPFILNLGYRLEGSTVAVLWKVENPSEKQMYFSIGGHPAFNCPLTEGTKQSDYSVSFADTDEIVSTRISEEGLATGCMDIYHLADGHLSLTSNLFDHDALVIEDHQTDTVALCRKDGTPYLTVKMEAPLFGIWSPPGKNAPFVCIEPWYGRCDDEYFDGDLTEREWGNKLAPHQTFEASYTITV